MGRRVVKDKHGSVHGRGRLRLFRQSGLQKLMRAAKRGRLPDDRTFKIEEAQKAAAIKPERYMHASARRRYQAAQVATPVPAPKRKRAPAKAKKKAA